MYSHMKVSTCLADSCSSLLAMIVAQQTTGQEITCSAFVPLSTFGSGSCDNNVHEQIMNICVFSRGATPFSEGMADALFSIVLQCTG